MLVILTLTILLLGAIWYSRTRQLKFWTNVGVKQTPNPIPFFGDFLGILTNTVKAPDFLTWVYNLYPNERYVGFYIFSNPLLLIKDPELIKRVTIKDFDHFTDHAPLFVQGGDKLWSTTLLNLTGEKWKRMRNTMSPVFSSSKLKHIHKHMIDVSKNFVRYFDEQSGEVTEVEMKDTFTRLTNDIIASTAFGVMVNSLKEKNNTFYEMARRISDLQGFWQTVKFIFLSGLPKLGKLLGMTLFDRKAAAYFCSVVEESIKAREQNGFVRNDIIDMLLEARDTKNDKFKHNGGISNFEISAQSVIFLFAGLDTVSTAMSFGSYELAMNKDIQDKLRNEILQTAKELKGGELTYDAIMEMKYMDMFLQETLRKWPPFLRQDRVCTKSIIIEPVNPGEKPLHIRKDQEIWIPTFGFQRDARYFTDPEKFDPERFANENKDKLVPNTSLPFGSGPRICIGNRFTLIEIKTMLFYLLSKYELIPTDKTPKNIVLKNTLFCASEGGLHMGLKRLPPRHYAL